MDLRLLFCLEDIMATKALECAVTSLWKWRTFFVVNNFALLLKAHSVILLYLATWFWSPCCLLLHIYVYTSLCHNIFIFIDAIEITVRDKKKKWELLINSLTKNENVFLLCFCIWRFIWTLFWAALENFTPLTLRCYGDGRHLEKLRIDKFLPMRFG